MRFLTSILVASLASASALDVNPFVEIQRQHASNKLMEQLPLIHQQIQDAIAPLHKFAASNFDFHTSAKFSVLEDTAAPSPTGTATGTTNAPASGTGSGAGTGTGSVAPQTACLNALTAVQAKAKTCGFDSTTAAPTSSTTQTPSSVAAAAAAQVKAVCDNTTCFADLQTQTNAAFKLCQPFLGTETASVGIQEATEGFKKLNEYISVGCTKDTNGDYCLGKFLTASSSFADKTTSAAAQNPFTAAISKDVLDQLCTPCSLQAAAAIASLSSGNKDGDVARSLALVCLKDPTNTSNYCVTSLSSVLSQQPTKSTNPLIPTQSIFTPAFTNLFCSPCLRKMMNILSTNADAQSTSAPNSGTTTTTSTAVVNAPLGGMEKYIDALCVVNDKGQRCISTFANAQSAFGETAIATLGKSCGGDSCSDSCRSAIDNLLSPFGCCLATTFQVIGQMGGSTTGSTANPLATLTQACNLNKYATPCGGSSVKVSVVLTLPNLAYTFYSNSKYTATVDAKLKADIAAAAGVSVDKVSIVVTQKGTGISITATLTGNTNTDSSTAADSINYQLSQKTLAFTSTAAYASQPEQQTAGSLVSNAPLTAGTDSQQAATTTSGGGNNGAASSSAAPAVVITGLLALVVAGLANQQ